MEAPLENQRKLLFTWLWLCLHYKYVCVDVIYTLSLYLKIAVCKCMLIDINAWVYQSSEWMCVFHWVGEREETRALEEITPHSLRVLVTHALLAAEWFPHFHTEVREAAPTAPPVSLRVPAESSWAKILLKKRTGKNTKPDQCAIKTTARE